METQLRFHRTLSRVHIDIPAGHLARNRSYKILSVDQTFKHVRQILGKTLHQPPAYWHWNYAAAKKDQKPLSWFCKAGSDWRPTTEVVSPLQSPLKGTR